MAARPRRPDWTAATFVLPTVLFLLLFQGWPLFQELRLSFTATSLLTPKRQVWVGLENYADLLQSPEFGSTLAITGLYTLACVALSVGLGLGCALLLDRPFPGRTIARAFVTLPWAAPPVAVALIFSWMLNAQYGVFNRALRGLGLPGAENWLDTPGLALPALLMATIWQIFPFSAVVLLAALQGVAQEQREAAAIDGAGPWGVFRAVVWPAIRPTATLLTLFITIWSLRRFDLIWLLTQGGPLGATNTLVVELYRRGFVYRELGTAASIGMVGLAIALLVTLLYFRFSRQSET